MTTPDERDRIDIELRKLWDDAPKRLGLTGEMPLGYHLLDFPPTGPAFDAAEVAAWRPVVDPHVFFLKAEDEAADAL